MFDLNKLPDRILKRTAGLSWICDDVGMSNATIFLFDEMVLKIEKVSRTTEPEKLLLNWLYGKLPVPKIIETVTQDGYSFLLMSKLSGEMACSDNRPWGFAPVGSYASNSSKVLRLGHSGEMENGAPNGRRFTVYATTRLELLLSRAPDMF